MEGVAGMHSNDYDGNALSNQQSSSTIVAGLMDRLRLQHIGVHMG